MTVDTRLALGMLHRAGETGRPGTGKVSLFRLAALVLLLPLIFEFFHYLLDIYPVYALSKALPILLSPLALFGLLRCRLPETKWFLAFALYAGLVTPFLSAVNFGESFGLSLATQTKALPISYYYSFYVILAVLRPGHRDMTLAVKILGVASLVAMPILWATVPEPLYKAEHPTLFFWGEDRGYRINIPAFFLDVLIFYANRRFWITRNPAHLLWIALNLAVMFVIYKERVPIAGVMVILLFGALSRQKLGWNLIFVALGVVGAAIAFTSIEYLSPAASMSSGSATTRQAEIDVVLQALAQNPLGYLIGLGTVSPISERGGFQMFYDLDLYLADLGWLGMVFEYGVIGCGLLAMIFYKIVRYFRQQLAFTEDPLLFALYDHIWYEILISWIWPVMYAPAEWAATFAVFVYFRRRLNAVTLRRDGGGLRYAAAWLASPERVAHRQ